MTAEINQFRRPRRHKMEHPKGYEPGVQWTPGSGGHLTVIAESEPDAAIWAHLIEDWDLNPSLVEVVPGSVQVRAWDANVGDGEVRRLKYYRATLRPRSVSEETRQADIEDLLKVIGGRKPVKAYTGKLTDIHASYLVLLADWQIGNGENGGTDKIVEQILGSRDRSVARAIELRKLGRINNTVVLAGLGDLVEGCSNFYAMQTFSVDRDNREQDRIARHLLIAWIDAFVAAGFEVVALGVGGNHGEARLNGKAYTSFSDNRDVQAFEIVAEIIADNPRYAGVSIPLGALDASNLAATIDIEGIPCSFVHGHQFGGGSSQGSKINLIEKWFTNQVMGRRPVGDCEILFSGHFHHFLASEATGRQVFQSPASDTGSMWFTNQTGKTSNPGVLTLVVGEDAGNRGWNDLAIL